MISSRPLVERGAAALMAVLFLLFMLSVVLVIANQMATTDVHDSSAQNNSVEALFLAESGIERAAWRFANGLAACNALAEPAILHGRGQFTIAAGQTTDFNGAALPASQCRVRATGQITGSTVRRTIEGIVQSGASASVQSGAITMNPSTRNITLPSAVNVARSYVICQNRTDTSNASHRATCELTGPTTLTITAGAADSSNTVHWQVVEFFSGVTVERGRADFGAGTSTVNVALATAVALNETFVDTTERTTSTSQTIDEQWTTTATLTSPTNLQLTRNQSGIAISVAWQVVQITGAAVQSGPANISNPAVTTVAVTAVDPTRTFLIFTRRGGQSVNGREDEYQVRGELTNSTTLTFTRGASSNSGNRSVDISWFLVSLADGTTVQRGTSTAPANTNTLLSAISVIDTTRSVVFLSASGNSGSTDTADLDSTSWAADFPTTPTATSLRLRRGPGTGLDAPSQVAWFVVQFPNASNSLIQWREVPN